MAGAAVAESGRIPRPQVLRGLHHATIKKNLVVAGVLVFATALLVKFGRNDPRKRDYAEFYRSYDANKAFERMLAADVLDCTKPPS